ncbi:hypothetical protein BN7_1243 [Wickerhamomyces ciferrii]|uniref:cAMP-independent regulatory protein pac2 n=1 Tax=Wickerhamomyces ciferrii (strain ATCC 14091 / BCRC 22168 / CBS 111 / JCM 3599 / NBRC 0793 / NRRL Y-1031 F-60-10) TaxID=1206466 RepID=K0KHQ4_WICCF|nr:uncharacterized protein BN7_1243 [Wickerhamomyces ciferrii]CCH41702.1 hypothetical protein BN7_1243 [Wickerhamomyces ciferrii]
MESYHGAVLTPNDALILLEASRQKLIPKITRRLKDSERELIKPGSIYIFNEKEAKMRRWTDGRSWSASRVTGAFLTYREMEVQNGGDEHNLTDFKYKSNGLIKQSFSLTTLNNEKLHLISYTTTKDFTNLKFMNLTPSNDPLLKDIKIPKNIYPQHAFLDNPTTSTTSTSSSPNSSRNQSTSSTDSTSPIIKTKSPITSPIYKSFRSISPSLPIQIKLPQSSIPQQIPLQQQPIQPIQQQQQQPLPLSTPHSKDPRNPRDYQTNYQVQLPPIKNLNFNKFKIDYDEKALNQLNRFF